METKIAIGILKNRSEYVADINIDAKIAYKMAIEALEKQISKEVDTDTINKGIGISGEYDIEPNMLCPNCKAVVGNYESEELYFDYCPTCGQKLKAPQDK